MERFRADLVTKTARESRFGIEWRTTDKSRIKNPIESRRKRLVEDAALRRGPSGRENGGTDRGYRRGFEEFFFRENLNGENIYIYLYQWEVFDVLRNKFVRL